MNTMPVFADPLPWLLDPADPGPRYLALRDLIGLAADDPELVAARAAAHAAPPIAAILRAMQPEGYWAKPGTGYGPKYRSTVWALIALSQVGASAAEDERVGRGCAYLLDHALTPGGQFSCRTTGAPSGAIDCLQGNLLAALLALGYDDPRLDGAFEWMARTVTGEGLAPANDHRAPLRYYAYKSGPLFQCGANNHLPCAWGAAKVMLAFGKLPPERRTPLINGAIRQGAEFLLDGDPAAAGWPSGYADKPSGNWWKFGFPVFYVTDLLQVIEALAALGWGEDERLAEALALAAGKADEAGRWTLEYDYAGKMWGGANFGEKGRPNKWVTIRASRAFRIASRT
jgi:hypothetical protein